VLADLEEYTKATSEAATRLDRRIDAIRRERRKWAEKAMNGTVPDDIAREKQHELAGQLAAAESARAKLTVTSEQHETAIRSATALLPILGEAYRRGNSQLRREFNQAWFEQIRFSTKDGRPHIARVERT
jgi:site-specific DNA recombinase